jgi:hypothetical protein
MNLKNHDIGKIAGCLVVAAGLREVFALIFHLILKEEYGDVSFLFIFAIPLGIGLYYHWFPAYILALSTAGLGELFVIMIAIEAPIKIGLGKISLPYTILESNVKSYTEIYALLAVCGIILAVPIYFLLTEKAREEFNYSKWVQSTKKQGGD